jgi:hypothetical protein
MNLTVQADFTQLTKNLSRIQREQVPFAISLTLNELGLDVANAITVQMDRYLDRPTPFTKRAFIKGKTFNGKRATKKNFEAIVEAKQIQAEYLKFQIAGGTRLPNKTAILVPTRAAGLNKYGNISRANQKKIAKSEGKFFKAGVREGKTPGVYKRTAKKIEPYAFYVDSATYDPIFPIDKIARGVVGNRLKKQFEKALARALQTAR